MRKKKITTPSSEEVTVNVSILSGVNDLQCGDGVHLRGAGIWNA